MDGQISDTMRSYVEQASGEDSLRLERQGKALLAIGYDVDDLQIVVWPIGTEPRSECVVRDIFFGPARPAEECR